MNPTAKNVTRFVLRLAVSHTISQAIANNLFPKSTIQQIAFLAGNTAIGVTLGDSIANHAVEKLDQTITAIKDGTFNFTLI
jgi:hypothetical protein